MSLRTAFAIAFLVSMSLTTTASLTDWLGLAAYAVLFAALAVWGYRHDEVSHHA